MKSLRPLPEKWHGLQDVEARYRQRYVDLIVNPESRVVFQRRTAVIRDLRDFLAARGFLEVETPMMQPFVRRARRRGPSSRITTRSISTSSSASRPELYLKRLVVGGFERVFEMSRNFPQRGHRHHTIPEFTMLEFYQAYATYEDLMDLTEEMVVGLAQAVAGDAAAALARHGHRPHAAVAAPDDGGAGRGAGRARRRADAGDAAVLRALAERTGGIERPSRLPGELLGRLLRAAGRAHAGAADVRLPVPGRDVAAGAPERRRPARRRSLRADRGTAWSWRTPSPS